MHKLVLTLRLCKTAYRVTIHFKPPQLNICPVSFALRGEISSIFRRQYLKKRDHYLHCQNPGSHIILCSMGIHGKLLVSDCR